MSLPGMLGFPEKKNPTIHIVFAYSYRTDTSLPMDYWIEGEVDEDEFWLDEFIDGDPNYIHNDIRHYDMPEDANGIFEFVGKIQSGRSTWEATVDDDVWLEGDVAELHKVQEHV